MSRLPSHHVARPRLTDRCLGDGTPVVVVEAAAGYGKSVLGAELIEVWGAVPVEVLLEEGGVSAQLLAGRLRAAVARAGFLDAAGSMAQAGEDAAGAVDAMLAALAGEPCAIVVDDAHHAARDAAVLIDRIAGGIAAPGHLVVLARHLPPGAERLRRAEAVVLRADDLALQPGETLALCRSGFGLDVSADEAQLLDAATGGWTAAAVLAMSRAARTPQPLADLARAGADGHAEPWASVGSILDELIVALGPDRRLLGHLAPLPLLDPELVGEVTGEADFFDRAAALGLPLTPAGGGWWELPGAVRDHLSTLDHPSAEALARAARQYVARGHLGTALQLLLGAGQEEEAAEVLAATDLQAIETVDALELLAAYERIPPAVLADHPRATFQVARACGIAALLAPRRRLFDQLYEQVPTEQDPALRRAVDAERAVDLLNAGRPADGEELGRQVLASAGKGEQLTRARALIAVGFGLCLRRDPDGRLSEASLREASQAFDQASRIYHDLGYAEGTSGIVAPRAIWTELGVGRPLAALALIDAGLADCSGRSTRVGRLLFHRAQVLGELGRFDEGEADLAEVERIGRRGDPLLVAFSYWGRMALASARGDAAAVLDHAHEVDANRGEWWDAVGADFLAEAADCLDRVGHAVLAAEYLARAKAEPHPAERWTAMAECAVLARHGDPELAEVKLSEVDRHGIFPKDYWRVTLLRAYAAWRRGDPAAGALAARAFEQAARLGQPRLPLIRERELAESLLALAVATGSPAAAALEAQSVPVALAVLGRFELTRGGRAVALGPGQASQLLKLVAVSGRVPVDRAIDTLWPEVDPPTGRNRLRTVLGRLREVAPEAVRREGDLLVLGAEVRLDLAEFRDEARQALALRPAEAAAVAVASSAVARYRGDLLPDDLYEEWADVPREEARRTMLDLLDLCAAAAAERGDLDEARRIVQRTIELAPYDDDRYLRVAAILNEQGRRGAALSVIRRARSTLATLGLELPPQLLELQSSLVGSTPSQAG